MKYGDSVIFEDRKYKYEGKNPDGSILLSPWGSNDGQGNSIKISAPADRVRQFMREGRTNIGGSMKLNG